MSIEIKRIYLENYKLFTLKELTFSENLCVFDGPNGYGKTSIFDAIEFLITGSISRIQESEVIAANLSYSKNCLANDADKDIRIKAEFKDNVSNRNLVIALCIPASTGAGRQNNPKSIEQQTKSYILPTYDIPSEIWNEHLVSMDEITSKRKAFFGEQNIALFKILHYIHQEDRLAYFKKSESERGKTITDLFGIEHEVSKLKKINDTQLQLSKKLKNLKDQIKGIESEIKSLPQSTNNLVGYESLTNGTALWDNENLGFQGPQSKTLFEQFKGQINDTIVFVNNKQWYFISVALRQFEKVELSKRSAAIHGWFIKQSSDAALNDIRKRSETLNYLADQSELISNDQFINVDWKKICAILDSDDALETIVGYVDDLKRSRQNQTNLDKLATSFYQARETLAKKKKSIDSLNDGMCPYCGYHWDSDKLLQEQFAATKPILENLLGGGNAMFDQALERCRKYYADIFKERIEARIAYITNDQGVQLLSAFKDFKDFKLSVENCDPILKHLQTSEDKIKFDIANIDFIESTIAEIKESIPPNCDALAIEHGFDKIYKEYFSNNTCLGSITVEKLKDKARYVENQYYASFDKVRQNLDLMKQQRDKLEPLQDQMKTYHLALKKSIDSYQKLVIKQIEIPFFLYCSRLLQSYQGGQGVLIDSKDSKIRFTAPGGEHDILYTMSSGQLSAVLLAFSLVLNKIYSGNDFTTLFIDDPIQCMDDINMISFVELLRREFSDSQIVLSTHEDTFANYIKYKFSKYNIRSQSITLKTDA